MSHLPVARGEVLQGAGRPLQGGGVGALGQQGEVGLHHRRVPQHLSPLGGLGEAGDGPHAVPLPAQNTQTHGLIHESMNQSTQLLSLRGCYIDCV